MLRVQGHPFLTVGFKLWEEDKSIATSVADFLQSRLPPMSSVVAGIARGVVVHPGYLMHPRVLVALMSGLSEAQCLRVRNLSPSPAPGSPSEAPQGLAAEAPARPEPERPSPPSKVSGGRWPGRSVAGTVLASSCPAEEVVVGLRCPYLYLSLTVRLGTRTFTPRGSCPPRLVPPPWRRFLQ
jgi:hypothetical protein